MLIMSTFMQSFFSLVSLILSCLLHDVVAFDNSRKDNLAVYWGQDSAGNQKSLSFYCADDTIDVFPLAFLYIFRGTGGEPVIDLANICNQWDDPVFPGTALANCSFLASDIKECQSKGKLVTLSLGGATGEIGFSSDSQAQSFADQIWNLFLGGSSTIRPFGDAVLDGLDLDIESGTPAHYAAFVNRIRSLANETVNLNETASAQNTNGTDLSTSLKDSTGLHNSTSDKNATSNKYYYITAAPQCPFPDAYIGAALNEAPFDAVYVQFYNNYCGLDQPSEYNFATWDNWAKTQSANPNIKVYIGAAGSSDSAGEGYVDADTVMNYVIGAQEQYSSFGGVMLWDASTAYTNNRFDLALKTAMVASAEKLFPNEVLRNDSTTVTKTALVKEPRVKSRVFRE
ncbi:Chitinase 2 [Grifola frondosa]|uniref:chitinase n=1 Tax=Grifola frondosa TaxID=5627 RepID=A0A1C7LPV7_GRIFR|nr:Chitinase 2 [Grifola frondosa]